MNEKDPQENSPDYVERLAKEVLQMPGAADEALIGELAGAAIGLVKVFRLKPSAEQLDQERLHYQERLATNEIQIRGALRERDDAVGLGQDLAARVAELEARVEELQT